MVSSGKDLDNGRPSYCFKRPFLCICVCTGNKNITYVHFL